AGTDLGDLWEWDGTTWLSRPPNGASISPPNQSSHALCYDSLRRCTVLFGTATDDTWEWDGTAWRLRAWANNPPRSAECAMPYDTARGVAVLVVPTGTWEWDGVLWQMRSTIGFASATLTYAAALNVTVVMQGSFIQSWNGTQWTSLPNATFSARSN